MASSIADPRIKYLRIKTGVLKRLAKEKQMYEKEVTDYQNEIEKMKVEGKDEYDIKKKGELLQESMTMVSDSNRRLEAAYEELEALIENAEDLCEAAEYKAAKNQYDSITI